MVLWLGYGGYPPISIPETPPVYIEQQDFVKSTAESQKIIGITVKIRQAIIRIS